jgi:hypothetical protein
LRYIESLAFQNALQLEYLNLQNELLQNESLVIEFQNQTLDGFTSIWNIYLNYEFNVKIIQSSLKPTFYKNLSTLVYLNSINLIYFSDRIDCNLTLSFMRFNLHLNLSTDGDVSRFVDTCYKFSLILRY